MTNVDKFNGNFYRFSDGLPMGAPLAPLVADIFMDKFEKFVFASGHPLVRNICYWHRYVDEVLCLWNGALSKLDNFLAFLHYQLHPVITNLYFCCKITNIAPVEGVPNVI